MSGCDAWKLESSLWPLSSKGWPIGQIINGESWYSLAFNGPLSSFSGHWMHNGDCHTWQLGWSHLGPQAWGISAMTFKDAMVMVLIIYSFSMLLWSLCKLDRSWRMTVVYTKPQSELPCWTWYACMRRLITSQVYGMWPIIWQLHSFVSNS